MFSVRLGHHCNGVQRLDLEPEFPSTQPSSFRKSPKSSDYAVAIVYLIEQRRFYFADGSIPAANLGGKPNGDRIIRIRVLVPPPPLSSNRQNGKPRTILDRSLRGRQLSELLGSATGNAVLRRAATWKTGARESPRPPPASRPHPHSRRAKSVAKFRSWAPRSADVGVSRR